MNLLKLISNPRYRFDFLCRRGMYKNLVDDAFLKKAFKIKVGRNLDLQNPKTYNEKLQWLKLYNRRSEYTTMVDKYLVRDFVKEKIGEEYLIPLLGVWENPDDINFDALPDKFVLKCNHNSGLGMYICKDKSTMDEAKVRSALKKGLAQNYYLSGREWPYKNVRRRIIAEQYMEDRKTAELRDYKFYCFNGVPKVVMINGGRGQGKTTADYYDMDMKWLDFTWGYPHSKASCLIPKCFEKMQELASVLSADIPHVRVDFYEVNGQVYFGELTFFDGSGFDKIEPEEWEYKLGDWLILPSEKITE